MKRKFILKRVKVRQINAFEQYLNNMAKQGWLLKKMRWGLYFEKSLPQDLHYHVALDLGSSVVDPNLETVKSQEQKDFLVDFGYQYVCQSGVFQVYVGDDKQSLYNDEYVDSKALKRVLLKEMFSNDIYPLGLWLLLVIMTFLNKYQQLMILKNNALIFLYSFVAIVMIFIAGEILVTIKLLNNQELKLSDLKSKFNQKADIAVLLISGAIAIALLPIQLLLFGFLLIGLIYLGMFMINEVERQDPIKRFALMLIVSSIVLMTTALVLNGNVFIDDALSILIDYETKENIDIYELKGLDNYIKDLIIECNEVKDNKEIINGIEIYRNEDNITVAIKNNRVIVGELDEQTIVKELTEK